MPDYNTSSVMQVLMQKRISDASDIEIAQKLSIIYYLIGLRPNHFPTPEEDAFLYGYIRKKYSHKTLEELVLAFELAIDNKLDLEDVKVYDQFTPEYLTRIMNAYKSWLNQLHKNKKPEKMENEKVTITDEYKLNEIDEWLNKKDINLWLIPVYLYYYLKDLNFINLTNAEKKLIFKKAKELYFNKIQKEAIESGNIRSLKTSLEVDESNIERIRNLARKIVVYDFLILNSKK